MKIFVFPGQGSQSRGMGGELFKEFPELVARADKILGYSIEELCLHDKNRKLNKTEYTQPALYIVNALSYYKALKNNEAQPDYLAGHSLGEYNALLAAECFDFETGLKLVKKRGKLMSLAKIGSMAAIVGAYKEDIERILQENGLNNIELANYNTPRQIVISGDTKEISEAHPIFENKGMSYYFLKASGAFHSSFMQESRVAFQEYLQSFKFSNPCIPVISNVTARAYGEREFVHKLADQITHAVRWNDTIQYLLAIGLGDTQFKEIGHGNVLSKLIGKIRDETPQSVLDDLNQIDTNSIAKGVGHTDGRGDSRNSRTSSVKDSNKSTQGMLSPEDKATRWNDSYPVGTKVKSLLIDEENLVTRTKAMVLFGHRVAIYMEGHNGYFDLDEILPI